MHNMQSTKFVNDKIKCTCFKNNICKIGIPINSLEKYIEKLDLELNSKTQIFKSKHRYSILYRKLKNGDK